MNKLRQVFWLEKLGIVSVFLTLISLVAILSINFRPLYVWSIDHLNILAATELSKETLLKNYDLLMNFLNNPFNTSLDLPDFVMSVSGRGHFYDVKKLFMFADLVFLVTAIPSVWFLKKTWQEKRLWRLIRPFQWGMVLPVVLGFFMMMGFDQFFIKFHQLLFSNDDWLFNPVTDPIITVLPESYFMYHFILAFVLLELFFGTLVYLGKRQLKKL
ncbi:MAG: TIGR01906 family membrane protein [Enterococcus sp.]